MSGRGFVENSVRYGSIYRMEGQIACRTCGQTASINIKTAGGSLLPASAIQTKFEQKGWTVGPNPKWDYCPVCSKKEKAVVLKVTNDAATELKNKPREMTREDRRIIFEKLNEVYLDENRGYDAGWSDHRVATDLAVPRKWVETIRDENFGPIGTNEDMQVFLTEAEALLADARKALTEAKAAREACEAIMKNPAFLTFNDLSGRVSKIEKLATEVRKLVVV